MFLEPDYEDPDVKEKKKEIEKCLENLDYVNLEQWQDFAKGKAGLISGKFVSELHYLFINISDILCLKSFGTMYVRF